MSGTQSTTLVRAMASQDIDRVAEIEELCFSNPWAKKVLAAELERSWARVLVAQDTALPGAPIIAFMNYWIVADEVHVLNVATDPAYRRRGYARALLVRFFENVRALRAKEVLLEVRPSNTIAIGLYESFGFRAVGTRPRYYDDGEAALLMSARMDVE